MLPINLNVLKKEGYRGFSTTVALLREFENVVS
jgi:hypothetical protein